MDQLESDISELEFNITHTLLDYSDMEEALDNPPPMEMERVEEQKQGEKEVDSTFIRDMGLDKEQEMEPGGLESWRRVSCLGEGSEEKEG